MSEWTPRVVVLSGGVGGARLVHGLAQLLPPERLTVVVNTGDDFEHLGLRICPDLDTVMYTLAGLSNEPRGWGLERESHEALAMCERLGHEPWFALSDQDLGTHLRRTQLLRDGWTLTHVTAELCRRLDVAHRLLPMSDAPCPTTLVTADGRELGLQDWLVRHRAAPALAAVRSPADPGPTRAVLDAIAEADLVVLTPSNPWVSIEPILARPGLRARLATRAVIGVSPLIGGRAVKGPLEAMVRSLLGVDPSASVIASRYADILDGWVVAPGDGPSDTGQSGTGQSGADQSDASPSAAGRVRPRVFERDILLPTLTERTRFARELLELAQEVAP